MTSKRILMIESEEGFAQSLVSAFSRYDADVTVIADGKEGLDAAKKDVPDLILLRVELPRTSGYSICNKLKKDKNLKPIPLIIMSSEATEETFTQHQKLTTRAQGYISVSFDNEESTVEQLLEKAQALVKLDEVISPDEEEIITLDEEEAFAINDVEELEQAENERNEEEAFEMAFDNLEMKDEEVEAVSEPVAPSETPSADEDISVVDELSEFENVLESLDQSISSDLAKEFEHEEEYAQEFEQEKQEEYAQEFEQEKQESLQAEVVPFMEEGAKKSEFEEREKQRLEKKIANLESRLADSHKSMKELEKELEDIRSQGTSKDRDVLALKATINTKDREILELKEEQNRKEQEKLEAQDTILEREGEISKSQEVIAKMDRKFKEQVNKFDELLASKNELEDLHQTKMNEWEERYNIDTKALEDSIDQMKVEHKEEIDKAHQSIEEAEGRVASLRAESNEANERHRDEIFGLRTRSKEQIDTLEDKIDELSNELRATQEKYNEERSAHESMRSELDQDRNTISDMEKRANELETFLAEYKNDLAQAQARITSEEEIKNQVRDAVETAFTLLSTS